MKIYTKTGDMGTTSLLTGERVDKTSLRVEAYGTIDEISSVLGVARTACINAVVKQTIYDLQKLLMLVMADLASIKNDNFYITNKEISLLEDTIDNCDVKLEPLKNFIISGDNSGAAFLDMARTVIRRAERQVLNLMKQEKINEAVVILLNRMSDLCFVLSRVEAEVADVAH